MPETKKNNISKTASLKKAQRSFGTTDDKVWFPEQLALPMPPDSFYIEWLIPYDA